MDDFLKELNALPRGSVSAVIWENRILAITDCCAIAAKIEDIAYHKRFNGVEIRLYLFDRQYESLHFFFTKKVC